MSYVDKNGMKHSKRVHMDHQGMTLLYTAAFEKRSSDILNLAHSALIKDAQSEVEQ
ncbi:MAG: hypothetical protein R8M38_09880 [Mariprofundaceae bacterium]